MARLDGCSFLALTADGTCGGTGVHSIAASLLHVGLLILAGCSNCSLQRATPNPHTPQYTSLLSDAFFSRSPAAAIII